jgi:transcription elongation GreA/GreB family factor
MAQKAQLERELARARVTDFKDAPSDQVGVGSAVEVRHQDGADSKYSILGAWDSDPANHIISYKTPLGGALLGKRVGDTVKVKTGAAEEAYTIVSISRYSGQA